MKIQIEKSSENRIQSVNRYAKENNFNNQQNKLGNNAHTAQLKAYQDMANSSPRVKQLKAYQDMANSSNKAMQLKSYQSMANESRSGFSGNQAVQRMTIRGAAKAAEVAGPTHTKHVVAEANHQTDADSKHTSMTYVLTDADLTTPADGDNHNFTAANGVSEARFNFNAPVTIYQYDKIAGPGAGVGTSARSINGVATTCQIGVKKTGDEKLKVDHFMKI